MSASFLQTFNRLKIVHCMCPHCDSIVRVSDLHLRSSERSEKTWLDAYDSKKRNLEKKEEDFEKKKIELRQRAQQRGRKKVPELINRSLAKGFLRLNYNPYDVKSILHPIDFVAFRGMSAGHVEDVTLLSRRTAAPRLRGIHEKIADAVRKKSYDWKILHVAHDGQVEFI